MEQVQLFISNVIHANNQQIDFWYGYPIVFFSKNNKDYILPLFYIPLSYSNDFTPSFVPTEKIRLNQSCLDILQIDVEIARNLAESFGLFAETNTPQSFSLFAHQFNQNFEDIPLNVRQNPSIWFQQIIIRSEKSNYTRGLIEELDILSRKDKEQFNKSCLSSFFGQYAPEECEKNQTEDIYEIFSLNESQRKAVTLSLKERITVIPGPPGTGKSQVVASIIANAFLKKQKVLFASKNHKAVRVVEEKLNNLLNNKLLLRLGNRDNNGNELLPDFIQYLNWLDNPNHGNEFNNDISQLNKEYKNLIEERKKIESQYHNLLDIKRDVLNYSITIKRDENFRSIFEKLNKNTVVRGQLLNRNIKKIANYIRMMSKVNQFAKFEDLINRLTEINKQIVETSVLILKCEYNQLPQIVIANGNLQILHNLINIQNSILNGNLNSQEWGHLVNQRDAYYLQTPLLFPAFSVTNLSIKGQFPLEAGCFDLVIIDEASQCDIASVIPLLYRAKRCVILGDKMQLKHIPNMPNTLSVRYLLKYNLESRFDFCESSLYDFALSSVKEDSKITLNEHFRSHIDIITFSNKHWYSNQLMVSTNYNNLVSQEKIGIEWVDVQGEVRNENGTSAFNQNEINKVVQVANSYLNNSDFHGDIGIVSPFRTQANKIRISLPPNNARCLIDTVVKFQGDEKDIIIFSPVLSNPIPHNVSWYLKETWHLLNVAITRAKSKLIIVGDKQACLNSGIEHYVDIANYVDNLQNGTNPYLQDDTLNESEYEKMLRIAMRQNNIIPHQQYWIGPYRVDFAFPEPVKLVVEVDGLQHRENENFDMIRDYRLRNLGWEVLRFWTFEIRDDLQNCIEKIKEHLLRINH
ncbi:MAG: AAA domain-containing protein [Candidatus Kapabacteria bacterium]|nr:AAA domain-containing protein [Candidatus Kapabacteria bacterium]